MERGLNMTIAVTADAPCSAQQFASQIAHTGRRTLVQPKNNPVGITALYCRLSRDDGTDKESKLNRIPKIFATASMRI